MISSHPVCMFQCSKLRMNPLRIVYILGDRYICFEPVKPVCACFSRLLNGFTQKKPLISKKELWICRTFSDWTALWSSTSMCGRAKVQGSRNIEKIDNIGALDGGSPISPVDFKKWQCPLSLF